MLIQFVSIQGRWAGYDKLEYRGIGEFRHGPNFVGADWSNRSNESGAKSYDDKIDHWHCAIYEKSSFRDFQESNPI